MFKKIENQIIWKICFDLALCLLLLSAVLFFATGAFCADEKAEPTEVFADMGTGIQTEPPIIYASNTLCEDTVNPNTWSDVPVFGSELLREQIKTITFVDTLADAGENAWDVSAAKDNSVLAWTEKNGELYDLFIGAEGGMVAPDNCSNLFAGYMNVTQIVFDGIFDTSSVTDMSAMFRGCDSLAQLDLSGFDTSSVMDMSEMFRGCDFLAQLDLSGFDTSSVTDMSGMFNYCFDLEQLDLSGFDTSSVTDMSEMFSYCNSSTQLDLSGFDTSSVTNMSEMFRSFDSSAQLDLSGLDTSSVTDMSRMFYESKALKQLNLSGLDTSSVTNMYGMFEFCESLEQLDLSGFDTSSVRNMGAMFSYCESLEQLDLSGFDTSSVIDMSAMFYFCKALEQLDLSGFDTSSVTDMSAMFSRCESLEQLDLSGFDTSSVRDMSGMFYECKALDQLDLSGFTISSETDCSEMLFGCESLDLTRFDTSFMKNLSKESFQLPEKWEYRFPEPLLGSFGGYTVDAGVVDMEDGEWFGFEDRLYTSMGHCTTWCTCHGFECQVEASSTLAPQGNVSYDACHLAEETRNSVWSEGVEGDGIGETISIRQAYAGATKPMDASAEGKLTFTSICIVNGYAQDKETWQRNGRVKSLKLYYAGEYMGLIELKDTIEPQYIDVSCVQMKIGNGHEANFSFEIAEVYKGTKYSDTCLTGILIDFDGRRGH